MTTERDNNSHRNSNRMKNIINSNSNSNSNGDRDNDNNSHMSSQLESFVLHHMGDYQCDDSSGSSAEELKKKLDFNLNLGRAVETLRRELPMVFH